MSAWKNPSRRACCRNSWITRVAIRVVSWPAAISACGSPIGNPSAQSEVSTQRADNCQCGSGT